MRSVSHMKRLIITMVIVVIPLFSYFTMQDVYAAEVASGTCGDNITWVVDNEGVLTLSGSGKTPDYDQEDLWGGSCAAPWYPYKNSINKVVVSDGITSIGAYSFNGLSKLKDIEIAEGVQTIGKYSFRNCTSLFSITLPEGLISIGMYSFVNCSNLLRVSLPDSLTSIDWSAFYQCTNLQEINIPAAVTKIGYGAFEGCGKVVLIVSKNSYGHNYVINEKHKYDLTSGHQFNYYSITEPTCIEEGLSHATCKTCGFETEEIVPPLGHDWDDIMTIDQDATCIEDGVQSIHCRRCGERTQVTPLPAAHKWLAYYTTDKPATCTEEGIESIHCSVCNAIKEDSVRPKAKEPHSFTEWIIIKKATCVEDGERQAVCSICGESTFEVIEATGHNFEKKYTIDRTATCSTEGSESIHCQICGEIKTDSVRPIEKDPDAHNYGDWATIKVSSCIEKGLRKRFCSYCGKEEVEEIPITDHSYEDWVITRYPTCTSLGERKRTCEVCNKIESETLSYLAHSYGQWETIRQATETRDGVRQRTCGVCGYVQYETILSSKSIARQNEIDNATSSYESRLSYETSVPKLNWKANEAAIDLLNMMAHDFDSSGAYYSVIESADDSYYSALSYETSVPKLNWKAKEAEMNLLQIIAYELDTNGVYYSATESADDSYYSTLSYETSVPKLTWKANEASLDLLKIIAHELDSSELYNSAIGRADDSYISRLSYETSVPKLNWKANEAAIDLWIIIAHELDSNDSSYNKIERADDSYESCLSWETSVEKLNWKANEASMKLQSICATKSHFYFELIEEAKATKAARDDLNKTVDDARKIKKGYYSDESYKALQDAIAKAEALSRNEFATKEQLDAAVAKITRAKAALKVNEPPVGTKVVCGGNTYRITSDSGKTVAFTKAKNAKSVVVPATIKINGKTYKVVQINAKAFTGKKIRTVTIGKNVKKIRKNAFKESAATKLVIKTKQLKKNTVKGSLKGSKIKTVQVKISRKSVNKKFVKTYKKILTKANAGRKVSVK